MKLHGMQGKISPLCEAGLWGPYSVLSMKFLSLIRLALPASGPAYMKLHQAGAVNHAKTWNIESRQNVKRLLFDVGRWTFDVRCSFFISPLTRNYNAKVSSSIRLAALQASGWACMELHHAIATWSVFKGWTLYPISLKFLAYNFRPWDSKILITYWHDYVANSPLWQRGVRGDFFSKGELKGITMKTLNFRHRWLKRASWACEPMST